MSKTLNVAAMLCAAAVSAVRPASNLRTTSCDNFNDDCYGCLAESDTFFTGGCKFTWKESVGNCQWWATGLYNKPEEASTICPDAVIDQASSAPRNKAARVADDRALSNSHLATHGFHKKGSFFPPSTKLPAEEKPRILKISGDPETESVDEWLERVRTDGKPYDPDVIKKWQAKQKRRKQGPPETDEQKEAWARARRNQKYQKEREGFSSGWEKQVQAHDKASQASYDRAYDDEKMDKAIVLACQKCLGEDARVTGSLLVARAQQSSRVCEVCVQVQG